MSDVQKHLEIEAFQEVRCQLYDQREANQEGLCRESMSGLQNTWKQKHIRQLCAEFMSSREKQIRKFCVCEVWVGEARSVVEKPWKQKHFRKLGVNYILSSLHFWKFCSVTLEVSLKSHGNRSNIGSQVSILFYGRSIFSGIHLPVFPPIWRQAYYALKCPTLCRCRISRILFPFIRGEGEVFSNSFSCYICHYQCSAFGLDCF